MAAADGPVWPPGGELFVLASSKGFWRFRVVSIIGVGSTRSAQAQSFIVPEDVGAVRADDVDAAEGPALLAKMTTPASADSAPSARVWNLRN